MDNELLGDLQKVADVYFKGVGHQTVTDFLKAGDVKSAQAFMFGAFTVMFEDEHVSREETQKRIALLQMSDEDRISLLRGQRIMPEEKVGYS